MPKSIPFVKKTALPSLTATALANPQRRRLIAGTLSSIGIASLTGLSPIAQAATKKPALTTFKPIPPSTDDAVHVPMGYQVDVLFAWGDPISDGPLFKSDASQTAAEQLQQGGMHHDGMWFFPFIEQGQPSSNHGLLCINHEYTDEGLLHPDGMATWSAEKVAKSQFAFGVSVIEVAREAGHRISKHDSSISDAGVSNHWHVVRPSRFARRITAQTPALISGPAAGNAALMTAADPAGRRVLGTLANCSMGHTPWQTYLTCEENFNLQFHGRAQTSAAEQRYGIRPKGGGFRWHEHDARFDVSQTPNEVNRFGWVVEIDPWNPSQPPIKRTALGRFKHESATVTQSKDGRVVIYMGDDEANEYIYKFVSKYRYQAQQSPSHPHASLLDEGTLYVARFNQDGSGDWVALVHGQNGLTTENGFADQADILIRTRMAADQVGATHMDRPEWITVHPHTGEVYCSLTNNNKRKPSETDAANPRGPNPFGHLIRWREGKSLWRGADAAATKFRWDIFVLAGNTDESKASQANTNTDAFACPDGLWFDPEGRLWIQTDVSAKELNKGKFAEFGNNQMLVADTHSGEIKRFLSGPRNCELTGITRSPDGKTLFVNIQHPGEPGTEISDPANPTAISAWPSNQFARLPSGRPRSATLVITKEDGGIIGS